MSMYPFKIIKKFQINNHNLSHFPTRNKKAETPERSFHFDFFNRYIDVSVTNNFETRHFFPVFVSVTDPADQLEACYQFILHNKKLFQSKKLILVLIDIYESLEVNFVNNFASKVGDICNVYLIDCELKREKNIFVEHYPALHWVHHLLNFNIDQIIELNDDHKTFIFMNRRSRIHRIKAIDGILKNNLRNCGYITFTKEDHGSSDHSWPEQYPNIMSETFDILDYDNVFERNPTGCIPLDYCKKSFLFLNSETFCNEGRLFISEKTFKPLRIGMPFMTIANPGILIYLKNLGFKTFSNWIDESYDDEVDEDKKIKIIIQELMRFSKMDPNQRLDIREEMKPVLEHNKKLVEELTIKPPDVLNILKHITEKTST